MSNVGCRWEFENPGPEPVLIWLEPWADEFLLTAGCRVELVALDGCNLGEIEQSQHQITLWANAEFVQVYIDSELQRSTSAIVPAPRELTKEMLQIVFESQPSARLGGAAGALEKHVSWWTKMKARCGF
jgi:hypothetical protein